MDRNVFGSDRQHRSIDDDPRPHLLLDFALLEQIRKAFHTVEKFSCPLVRHRTSRRFTRRGTAHETRTRIFTRPRMAGVIRDRAISRTRATTASTFKPGRIDDDGIFGRFQGSDRAFTIAPVAFRHLPGKARDTNINTFCHQLFMPSLGPRPGSGGKKHLHGRIWKDDAPHIPPVRDEPRRTAEFMLPFESGHLAPRSGPRREKRRCRSCSVRISSVTSMPSSRAYTGFAASPGHEGDFEALRDARKGLAVVEGYLPAYGPPGRAPDTGRHCRGVGIRAPMRHATRTRFPSRSPPDRRSR